VEYEKLGYTDKTRAKAHYAKALAIFDRLASSDVTLHAARR
jgi:hypothetical protein